MNTGKGVQKEKKKHTPNAEFRYAGEVINFVMRDVIEMGLNDW
jgi:hypothetical protein